MSFHPAFEARIRDLGGVPPEGASTLKEHLLGITFPHDLYDDDWEVYGLDELMEAHRDVLDRDTEAFLDLAEAHYLSGKDLIVGQDMWTPQVFTPLTPDTPDFAEYKSWFDEFVDLSPIRPFCEGEPLEFVQILFGYGYPDHYYICLQDADPNDPVVIGTDHEEFFSELRTRGPLSDFLNQYLTRSELRDRIRDYLE